MVKRRIGLALIAACAAVLATSCAAGQHAATAQEQPSVDGSHGSLGSIKLLNVAIHAPNGPASFVAGEDAELQVVIVNTGHKPVTLIDVSANEFESWGIFRQSQANVVETADQTAAIESASASAAPSSAASTSSAPAKVDTGSKSRTIQPGRSLSLGLRDVGVDGNQPSPDTIVLLQLAKTGAPLFPASSINITFAFSKRGSTTLSVPVQLSAVPNSATLPGSDASGD
jgi:hypothetical protein